MFPCKRRYLECHLLVLVFRLIFWPLNLQLQILVFRLIFWPLNLQLQMMFYYFRYLLCPIVKQSVLLNKNQRKLEKKLWSPIQFHSVFSKRTTTEKWFMRLNIPFSFELKIFLLDLLKTIKIPFRSLPTLLF